MNRKGYKSGFVSIIGRPNVGNLHFKPYYRPKIAIMSDKPQTTRNKIQGVYTENDSQVIFIDTPGIHKPKHKLGDFMVKMAQTTLKEVDIVLFMVNAVEGFGRGEEFIIEKLKETKQPVFLVINKIDQLHPEQLLELIDQYRKLHELPISALDGNNVDALIGTIKSIYQKHNTIQESSNGSSGDLLLQSLFVRKYYI